MENTSKLVIVESPNKVETLKKYLGKDFDVMASVGHITKLSTNGKHGLGIDLEKWEPNYVLDPTKKNVVKELKEKVKKSQMIYIATDPDREGEAIGEHLIKFLKCKNYCRIKFNEITKDAVIYAVEHPGQIDENLIKAQKARRMLDRIIGFRLSQLMKKKLSNFPTMPSAGRVQSIALKLTIDREKEIEKFIPEEYNKLSAKLENNLEVNYINPKNSSDKREWILPNELENVKNEISKEPSLEMQVVDIKESQKKLGILTPLKQAVLYKKSPFNSRITQTSAQHLYEGYGDGGLISYPRTDSTRLSESFLKVAREYIKNKWGKEYILEEIKGFAGDQDAHEAIRPTDISLTPEMAKAKFNLSIHDYGVYKLIYEHTLQSLINPPIRSNKTYLFKKHSLDFKAVISNIIFNGYYVVKKEFENDVDPNLSLNQKVKVLSYDFQNCQTKPPARYTEGSLIEALDEIKVGRPSTFATTVKTILDRTYVENQNGSLVPTEFGKIVMDKLLFSFSNIINEKYTAQVEEELDMIAKGNLDIFATMQDFYDRFETTLFDATQTMEYTKMQDIELEGMCPNCHVHLVQKRSRYGYFAGCPNYPECKHLEPLNNKKFMDFNKYREK